MKDRRSRIIGPCLRFPWRAPIKIVCHSIDRSVVRGSRMRHTSARLGRESLVIDQCVNSVLGKPIPHTSNQTWHRGLPVVDFPVVCDDRYFSVRVFSRICSLKDTIHISELLSAITVLGQCGRRQVRVLTFIYCNLYSHFSPRRASSARHTGMGFLIFGHWQLSSHISISAAAIASITACSASARAGLVGTGSSSRQHVPQ